MPPLISAIIPVLHAGEKLKATLESIAVQDLAGLEVIVMDGGAEAATQKLTESTPWGENVQLRYVGEADQGVYDAMNKAIDRAAGRYLYFIGAGDTLKPGALATVGSLLPADDQTLLYGNVLRGAELYDGPFDAWRLCHRNICHQAVFYGRDVFRLMGRFSLRYAACADWEFNMRCFASPDIRKQYIEPIIADFERGGLSSRGDRAFNQDHWRLIARHLGWLPMARWAAVVTKTRLLSVLRRES